MRFFEDHFNRHHFLHAPHKWFFALLASPIHFAETRYKKRYKLNYENAKKLFVFDTSLLLAVLIIIGASIFWFTYKPEITDLVYLSIRSPLTRIASGEYVDYTIAYKNSSQITLTSPQIKLNLPQGFVFAQAEPQKNYRDFTFTLNDIPPQEEGAVKIYGWIFGTPDKEENIFATLSYQREKRKTKEEKTSLLIKTLRGSKLILNLDTIEYATNNAVVPFKIKLINQSELALNNMELSVNQPGVQLIDGALDKGTIENGAIKIQTMAPNDSAELTGKIQITLADDKTEITYNLTPTIMVNNLTIPQATFTHLFKIASPRIAFTADWQNNQTKIKPGETAAVEMNIKNSGNVDLTNGEISLPLPPAIVDTGRLTALNQGSWKNNVFTLTSQNAPGLARLKPNETASAHLQIPINHLPQGGADLTLKLSPAFRAQIDNLENNYFSETAESAAINIGTQVIFNAESRYYTNEGDQLGRGPLPPQVNKETKYWALFTIANSTSKITDLKLTAQLPQGADWTGKSSVSHGQNVIFNSNTRAFSWSLSSLAPQTQAGIYLELSLTPTAEQINTTPLLLQKINFTASDSYLNEPISRSSPDIDISLLSDALGKNKGIKVVD